MADPLSEIVTLLRPRTVFTKGITGAGRWAVRYRHFGHPSFCAVVKGGCRLALDGHDAVTLGEGDFVLLPTTPGFVMSGFEPAVPVLIDPDVAPVSSGELRHGRSDGDPDVRLIGGYFVFDSPDAAFLVSMLPPLLHLRGIDRLSTLVGLVRAESDGDGPGRDLILARLVEVLVIEAIRSAEGDYAPQGLLRGLADARLAVAIRAMHDDPARAWTVGELARAAALSRSGFFHRFTREVGLAPMAYLQSWRMALAKDLLRPGEIAIEEVAERVGYSSSSTFSTAFGRHVGMPPGRFARASSATAA
ncbi:MAG: AraC family transcriptional regulator [Bauldia sp.]|nr:AraC family transcriptional regulator [Bauldia sp.]